MSDELLNSPGAKRLIEHNKTHKQRAPKGLKGEEMKAHSERMGNFMQACRKNRGFATQIFAEPQKLITAIDEYVETILEIGMFPTWNGLAIYCDASVDTLYAVEKLGDERSAVLQKYKQYISEFFNQSGLSSSTNPVFSIYYGKSVLGQSDQTPVDVNINIGQARSTFSSEQVQELIELTPDDYSD